MQVLGIHPGSSAKSLSSLHPCNFSPFHSFPSHLKDLTGWEDILLPSIFLTCDAKDSEYFMNLKFSIYGIALGSQFMLYSCPLSLSGFTCYPPHLIGFHLFCLRIVEMQGKIIPLVSHSSSPCIICLLRSQVIAYSFSSGFRLFYNS